jgi:hypothetical protein
LATAQQERRETAPPSASPLDGYAPPTAGAGRRPGRALTALILGILSIPTALLAIVGLILGIIAVVLGATTRADIRRQRLAGEGQALAGLVLGSIGIALSVLNIVASVIIST